MKITYFINHYPKVSHTFIRNEILGLEAAGIDVSRVSIHSDDNISVDNPDYNEKHKTHYLLNKDKVTLFKELISFSTSNFSAILACLKLCFKMSLNSDRSFIKNLIYMIEGVLLAKEVNSSQSKHIHAHFGTNSTDVAMYASLIANVPYSFTVHGPEEFDRPFGINLSEKIKRADSVFAITKFCQSQLYRWCEYEHWKKIRIVHCGLGELFFDSSSKIPLYSSGDRLEALVIGRLCEQKGPMILLQALPELIDAGINIHVTFAGDGELREVMERFIVANNLQEQVTITGWVDSNRIKNLLQQASVMILPSFAEGLPVAIMEALALKVPVITTHINGIPELIEHEKSGILMTPGCQESLVEAVKTFHSLQNEDIQLLIDEGYRRVTKEHNSSTESVKIKNYLMQKSS